MSLSQMAQRAVDRQRIGGPRPFATPGAPLAAKAVHVFDKFGIKDLAAYPSADEAPVVAPSPSTSVIDSVTLYVPIEIITAYVAILATFSLNTPDSSLSRIVTFWVFLGLTPVTAWMLYAARRRADDAMQHPETTPTLPWLPTKWPWWEMISGAVAFAVWTYALPLSPFARYSWYRPALGTAGLLFVSFVLGLIEPLVTKPNPGSAATP